MSKSNESPVAIVTGGASGIGEAAVRRFMQAGWRVIIGDIDDARGKALASRLRDEDADVVYRHLDVVNEEQVEAFVAEIYESYGNVDALVNSGGVLQNAVRITTMAIADFDRIVDINVRGTLLVGRAVGARMAAAGSGAIINLCSLTTFQPWPQPAYAVSKVGVKMLTEIMAAELGPSGVRVNAVAPGYTLTPAMKDRIAKGERNPQAVIAKSALRRFVEPSEVGEAIYFLCSPAAAAITGATLPIDCGWLVYSVYSTAAAQPA